jgi:hypothetical protein
MVFRNFPKAKKGVMTQVNPEPLRERQTISKRGFSKRLWKKKQEVA